MKNLKIILVGLILVIASGCASGPQVGSLEYIDKQVFQCRELCSAGTVDISRIQGLECACNTRSNQQAPIFYNPMMGAGSSAPSSTPQIIMQPVSVPNTSAAKIPDVSSTAASIIDATGKRIFSQNKE